MLDTEEAALHADWEKRFQELSDFFYDNDTYDWSMQINEPNYLQMRCLPQGNEVIMVKIRL